MNFEKVCIIKKDNTREKFNVQKVVVAVNKSANRVLYTFSQEELDYICRFVEEQVEQRGMQQAWNISE